MAFTNFLTRAKQQVAGQTPTASPAVPTSPGPQKAPEQTPADFYKDLWNTVSPSTPQQSPWGGWNANNVFDYGEDLNPLSAQTGVSRDDLAGQRNAFLNPLEAQFREQRSAQGINTDATSANVLGSDEFKNFARTGQLGPQGQPVAPQSAMQSWIGGTTAASTNIDPANAGRKTALYDLLMGRAQQGLNVDRNNPAIRGQADAYAANEERAKRNYLGDTAEREGPYVNMQGESRMANERMGQRTGAFEAELVGRELTAKRQEISEALSGLGNLLTEDQRMELQAQLAQMDNAIRQQGLTSQNDQFAANLGLQVADRSAYWDALRRGQL